MKSVFTHTISYLYAFLLVVLLIVAITSKSAAAAAITTEENGESNSERATIMMSDNDEISVDVTRNSGLSYIDLDPSITVSEAIALTPIQNMKFYFWRQSTSRQAWPDSKFVSRSFSGNEPLSLSPPSEGERQQPPFSDAQRLYYYDGTEDAAHGRTFTLHIESRDGDTTELIRLRNDLDRDLVRLELSEAQSQLINSGGAKAALVGWPEYQQQEYVPLMPDPTRAIFQANFPRCWFLHERQYPFWRLHETNFFPMVNLARNEYFDGEKPVKRIACSDRVMPWPPKGYLDFASAPPFE